MKKFSSMSAVVGIIAAATLAGCPAPQVEPHTANFAAGAASTALDGKSTYYEVNGLASFYNRIVTNVSDFPVDPAGQTVIDFADADPFVLNLAAGSEVMYYGTAYSTLHIGSNGVIGFGSAGNPNLTLEDHFSANQISLLPVDASDTEETGTVSYEVFADSVVVTFDSVDGSSFQSEFFISGTMDEDINIAYPTVSADVAGGVVGLSNNQLANNANFLAGFTNSDLGSDNTEDAKLAY